MGVISNMVCSCETIYGLFLFGFRTCPSPPTSPPCPLCVAPTKRPPTLAGVVARFQFHECFRNLGVHVFRRFVRPHIRFHQDGSHAEHPAPEFVCSLRLGSGLHDHPAPHAAGAGIRFPFLTPKLRGASRRRAAIASSASRFSP